MLQRRFGETVALREPRLRRLPLEQGQDLAEALLVNNWLGVPCPGSNAVYARLKGDSNTTTLTILLPRLPRDEELIDGKRW